MALMFDVIRDVLSPNPWMGHYYTWEEPLFMKIDGNRLNSLQSAKKKKPVCRHSSSACCPSASPSSLPKQAQKPSSPADNKASTSSHSSSATSSASTTTEQESTSPSSRKYQRFMPRVDVTESDKAITIHADLPGINPGDVKLSMDKNVLTLSGKREAYPSNHKQSDPAATPGPDDNATTTAQADAAKPQKESESNATTTTTTSTSSENQQGRGDGDVAEAKQAKSRQDQQQHQVHLTERIFGHFQRCFALPEDLDTDNITATFSNGVLTISIPKKQEEVPECTVIPIKVKFMDQ
eukprot:TRINITY_DN1088_c0_g1::TRINITY_DN1088_c0_g1_i1::g.29990::m.29990 TRINITY_DN1088_c0_g1::TRINITY_DN1088_c0_g1_i1::g.29990  ORF type:complete len:295 (-),score=92.33,sp/Q76NU5/HSPGC_DICDI/26.74/2e-11,HSP20/PF00011.16/1.2e+04,HSP20/PF00011.16/0.00016,HSP20/PF00011.16/1.1e-14,DUF4407/PF14362.1/3.7 TRINITY_DN1088_c0_g1_i1:37-921(-)